MEEIIKPLEFEVEETKGLGLLQGEIRLMKDPNVKIPHIGWNRLELTQEDLLLAKDEQSFVYYVHSFYAQDYKEEDLIAYSNYGNLKIPGYVRHGHVFGMQYHPEKSGTVGERILKNFLKL